MDIYTSGHYHPAANIEVRSHHCRRVAGNGLNETIPDDQVGAKRAVLEDHRATRQHECLAHRALPGDAGWQERTDWRDRTGYPRTTDEARGSSSVRFFSGLTSGLISPSRAVMIGVAPGP